MVRRMYDNVDDDGGDDDGGDDDDDEHKVWGKMM